VLLQKNQKEKFVNLKQKKHKKAEEELAIVLDSRGKSIRNAKNIKGGSPAKSKSKSKGPVSPMKSTKKMVSRSPQKLVTRSPKRLLTKSPQKLVTKSPQKLVSRSPQKLVSRSPKKTCNKKS